ncbi:MAG: hypothetical protein R2822_16010 [Spirosomataceae bacterium]
MPASLLMQSASVATSLETIKTWLNEHPDTQIEVVFVGKKAEKLKNEMANFVEKTMVGIIYKMTLEPQNSPSATGLLVRITKKRPNDTFTFIVSAAYDSLGTKPQAIASSHQ